MTTHKTRFTMPSEPKNGLDLLRWLIFEPVMVERFSEKLSKKEGFYWFIRTYFWICIFSLLVWIVGILFVAVFDTPSRFPQLYEAAFIENWQQYSGILAKIVFLINRTIFGLGVGLFVGLFGGLFVGLGVGLFVGLVVGLFVGLLVGLLVVGLFVGLLVGGPVGGLGGLVFGLGGLGVGLGVGLGGLGVGLGGLGFGLGFGLFVGLFVGLRVGLGFGLVFGLGFYIVYFRLIFYPVYFLRGFFPVTFEKNPYRRDGVIWIPLWIVDTKLIRLAQQEPDITSDFVNFLLEYRPLQEKLAVRLLHAATAGYWLQGAITLNVKVLFPPSLPKKQRKFHPSDTWIEMLDQVRTQLTASHYQTQIGFKKVAFEKCFISLKTLRALTLRESRTWNHNYLEAIDRWIVVIQEKLSLIAQQAERLEPITTNIYRSGEALHPETDQAIFVGRDDLKDRLSFEILTARSMPMFLIQGQRRVGKTSLLNFLPDLLGSQFQIVFQDMQSEKTAGILNWLKDLREKVNKTFHISENAWNPPQDWLEAWSDVREHLEQISQQKECKIILAFDEYESFHTSFQANPQLAERLLGAMRSFSQHQNQVVFLFVGAKFFTELQAPNWNEYFVQVKHLRVDYLKREDTLQLIQRPVPEFNLIYPDDVAQRIFDLTQGHPALVQQICSEMVNLANRSNRKDMRHEDLDIVINEVDNRILSPANPTISVFWSQFCSRTSPETLTHRTTLKQILAGQEPTDNVSLFRLEQHGYIVKDDDTWKIRVPLFEMWLRKFAETFE